MNEQEKNKLVEDLETILEYVSQLNQLNTEKVEPAKHVLKLNNVMRKDQIKPSLPVEEVLKNAPEKTKKMFRVPGII
ncbi:MAG: Asp-tRNA(Asn)/Glu-tRNA(Gln) amidotransferase subunit GatC [Candidatus Omnitrophica bacterium]|nr:Asp-tRNA(Asn)/Glu-tRNA(Gln) amidotransferase subunit GatC [Candidatus Omnitrophota bacterium]